MTLVIQDPLFLNHKTGMHPECPERLTAIQTAIAAAALPNLTFADAKMAIPAIIDLVHDEKVRERVEHLSSQGGGYLDSDTILSQDSYTTALYAAGSAAYAVDQVMAGTHNNAMVLARPPGHHATALASMGFCLFNNAAIAAQQALTKHNAHRVLIIDWDVHHGNGTQDIFYHRSDVVFFSIHRYPFYPGTGAADEVGQGTGRVATINVPITFGVSRDQYLAHFSMGLEKALRLGTPDLIIISAGFDAHADDPVGNLGLFAEDYRKLTDQVLDLGCPRIVSLLEGGYNPTALGESVVQHLRGLSSEE